MLHFRTAGAHLAGGTALAPVQCGGARHRAWADPAALATPPRGRHRTTLLSPFDSLVWHRERTARLFGMDYVMELYVPQEQRQVTISMTADGRTYLDDAELAPGELADRLGAVAAASGGQELPLVTLRADRTLPYGNVMAVMGELNHSGFKSISLVTSGSVPAP